MKLSLISIYVPLSVALVAVVLLSRASAQTTVPPVARSATTTPTSGDVGTDLVAAFYEALLQDKPPTREQELALFPAESWVRMVLALKPEDYQDEGTEPMTRTPEQKENLRQRLAKVAAAGPVVLEYFRQHKDWFLPEPFESLRDISLSSRAQFVGSAAGTRAPTTRPDGFVVALVRDTAPGRRVARVRTVIFMIRDGKIDPDGIHLDGFGGKMTQQMLAERTPAPPASSPAFP